MEGDNKQIRIQAKDWWEARRKAEQYEADHNVQLNYDCTDGFIPDCTFVFTIAAK